MRNVSYVLIIPELGLWSEDNNGRVRDESRSLGYFLGSKLKQEKVKKDLFNGIYFKGVLNPENICYINKLLSIEISFPENSYPSKGLKNEINEYLIWRVKDGLLKIKKEYPDISDIIMDGINEFRLNDYVCNWVHKNKKVFDKKIQLRCNMDINLFRLYLEIFDKNKNNIYSKCILETPPNEYSFKHKFKDIIVEGNIFHITDFLDSKWFSFNLETDIS